MSVVHLSPAQAEIVKALADNPAIRIMWAGSNAAWHGPQSWKLKEQLGSIRSPTARALKSKGMIVLDPDGRWEREYMLSKDGHETAASLGPEDIERPGPTYALTAEDVARALHHAFPAPSWWTMNELAVGKWGKRYIDFFALRLIRGESYDRSNYLTTWAIEIKVSHSDFLSELADPEKRAPAMELADCFAFAAPIGMLDPAEIPEGLGLLEVDNRLKVQTTTKPSITRKAPPDWQLVAAMARASLR